jgi:glycosyltransferase involved in cell wall biosynthesis
MNKRVGLIYFSSYPDIRVRKFAQALASSGASVKVLCRSVHDSDNQNLARGSQRIEVAAVADEGAAHSLRTMPYPVNPLWRRAIDGLVTRDACDVLVVRDIPLALAALAVGRNRGVPVLLDLAENYPAALSVWRRHEGPINYLKNAILRNVTLARATERRACLTCDAVTVVVQESADRVVAMGVDPTIVRVVENTPDLAWFDDRLGCAPCDADTSGGLDLLRVIYTGELHVFRGLDTCISAMTDPDVAKSTRMCFVGKGRKEHYLQGLAAKHKVASHIDWVGYLPHSEMLTRIAAADVGIVPHHANALTQHTMPNKVYDYMACGKPVIVSDVAPMRRLVHQVGCGRPFIAGDPRDLSRVLLEMQDREARRHMGMLGQQAVRDRYNWGVDGAVLVETVRGLVC